MQDVMVLSFGCEMKRNFIFQYVDFAMVKNSVIRGFEAIIRTVAQMPMLREDYTYFTELLFKEPFNDFRCRLSFDN